MWAVAAQPRTGLTPMIPTPSVDSGIGHLCGCSLAALEPQDLVDEDDGDALGDDLAIDHEDLVHGAVDAVRRLGAGILHRERVVVDPAQAFLEVRHDLLRPHHEDDSPGAAGVRSELTAAHRGRQQRSGLGDRVDAAEHHLRRRGQAADLVGLGVAVQAPDPWSNGVVAGDLSISSMIPEPPAIATRRDEPAIHPRCDPGRSVSLRPRPPPGALGCRWPPARRRSVSLVRRPPRSRTDAGWTDRGPAGLRWTPTAPCRGCCALYACTCKYLTLNLGAHANTS